MRVVFFKPRRISSVAPVTINDFTRFNPASAVSGSWVDTTGNVTMVPIRVDSSASSTSPTVSSGKVTFNGTSDALVMTTPWVSRTTLPDASGATTGKGFTCTGLARNPTTGTLWLGNAAANDGVAPSLVETNTAGSQVSQILLKPIYPSIGSVQGVAFDTSDGTLWFASYSENKIHHLTTSGAHIESIDTGVQPNGLVYDPVNDQLVVMLNGGFCDRYSCSTLSSVSSLSRLTKLSAADQLFYGADNLLYATGGENGVTGGLAVLTSNGWSVIGHPQDSVAIEGISYNNETLYLANDAFFHTAGNQLNQLINYSSPQFFRTCRTVDMVVVFKQNANQAKTSRVCSVGDGVEGQGVGLFIPSNTPTTLRIIANTDGSTTTKRSVVDTTVATLATKSVIRIRANLTTGLATVSQNGSVLTSSASIANSIGDLHRCAFAIGGYDHFSVDRYGNLDVWDCYIAYDQHEANAIAVESEFRTIHSL
jgi:hypothetical protein